MHGILACFLFLTCSAVLSSPSSLSPFSHDTKPPYTLLQALPDPCLAIIDKSIFFKP